MSPWIARALRVMVAATLAAATIIAVGTFGAGERVAALDAWQINLRAELTGAGVAPGPGDPDGIGSAYVGVTPGSANLQFTLSAQGIEGQIAGPSTHLHAGAAGEMGPIVATLGSPSPDGTEFDGSLSLDGELLQDIADNPNNYYIDIHTPAFPDGALRGQLEPGPVNLSTWLLGASEVPGPGDPGMSGYAFVNVDPALQSVCWGLSYDFAGLVDPTSAAIHQAPAGSAGPAVVSLPPPVPPGTGSVCSDELDPATLQAVADDPGAYYLEISTAAYPAGAARGQLQHGYAQAPPAACAPLEICRGVLEPGTYTFTGFNTDLTFTTSIEFVAEPVIVEASEDDIAY